MKRWIKSALCVFKHSSPTDNNICRMLLPSFFGMILCMVFLAGTTWAWFLISVSTAPQTIETANYDVTVSIADENAQSLWKGDKTYQLWDNTEYEVVLTGGGTAPSGGYCVVNEGGNSLYTERILPGETLTFTLIPDGKTNYTFTAAWGKCTGGANITDGCTIGQKRADPLEEEMEESSVMPETSAEQSEVMEEVEGETALPTTESTGEMSGQSESEDTLIENVEVVPIENE